MDKEDSSDNSCSGGRWLDTPDLKTLEAQVVVRYVYHAMPKSSDCLLRVQLRFPDGILLR